MRPQRRPMLAALAAAVLGLALTARAQQPAAPTARLEALRELLAYDAKAPLDVQATGTQRRGEVTLTELSYASPGGGRVPATLVLPAGKGPFPAVLFQHWGQGTRSEFVEEAVTLARAGAASLLVDAPFVRPGPERLPAFGPEHAKLLQRSMVDLRRGVDLLQARPEVDAQRLAFVGHSFGAHLGGALAGAEKRLGSFVLMAGLGSLSGELRSGAGDLPRSVRKSFGSGLQAFLASIAPLDGEVGVSAAAPAAVFHQFARKDLYISPEAAMAYVDATQAPKLFKFYEGGHELNPAARRDRLQWLRTRLRFPGDVATAEPPMIAEPRVQPPEWTGPLTFEAAKLRPVYEVPGMEQVELRRDLVYARRGERELNLDVYLPDVARRRTVPVVMLVHGSAHPVHTRHFKDTRLFEGQARWMAATGLIVVVPAVSSIVRGADESQWYAGVPDTLPDVEDALAFIQKQGPALKMDTTKVCLVAFSAAGLYGLTPALRGTHPELRCAVGYYPLLAPIKGTLPREVLPLELLRSAKAPLPPLLLVRAGKDRPELNRHLDAFVREARRKKVKLTLLELKDGHHGFDAVDDFEDSRDILRATAEFLDAQLSR